eukprot:gb/GECH01011117.1/.p1 GENE.gb/GECH01011117.1/~~gb/GECH01011117.1/.p1  ORF type:complete len:319 (+),score=83.25 gb/GECH01011117.1/:1-957(+)
MGSGTSTLQQHQNQHHEKNDSDVLESRSSSTEKLSVNQGSSYGSFSPSPRGTSTVASSSASSTKEWTCFIEHQIDEQNDSLASIALRYGVREGQLRDSNGLFDDDIFHLNSMFVPVTSYTADIVAAQHAVLHFAYQDQIVSSHPTVKSKSSKVDKWQKIRQRLASSSNKSSLILGYLGNKFENSEVVQNKEIKIDEESNATKSNQNETENHCIYSDNYLTCNQDGILIYHYYWPNSSSKQILFSDIEIVEILDMSQVKGDIVLSGALFEDIYMNQLHKTQHKHSLNIRVKGNSRGILVPCQNNRKLQQILMNRCVKNM